MCPRLHVTSCRLRPLDMRYAPRPHHKDEVDSGQLKLHCLVGVLCVAHMVVHGSSLHRQYMTARCYEFSSVLVVGVLR
jgi:hypothetical protein